ncbi:MAG: hypothetical protein U0354_01940 [Candidatus Sericytochromatia bacterium]
MRNNFYNQGTNIIAHHYFNGNSKNNLNRVRYSVGFNPTIVSAPLPRRAKETDDNPKGMIDGGGYKGDWVNRNNPNDPNASRKGATDQQTFVIGSMGELDSVLKGGKSGQMLDLRDHQISPEVYMALARGQKVEVELQQMAPERVNLFTPLLASFMQIVGGAGGGVAYNEALTSVITGGATTGGGDRGQLGKAADFVNKYGGAYDLGFGTGEHIDVVAKFRILNEEKPNKPEEVVKITPYKPPSSTTRPGIDSPDPDKDKRDVIVPGISKANEVRDYRTTTKTQDASPQTVNQPNGVSIDPATGTVKPQQPHGTPATPIQYTPGPTPKGQTAETLKTSQTQEPKGTPAPDLEEDKGKVATQIPDVIDPENFELMKTNTGYAVKFNWQKAADSSGVSVAELKETLRAAKIDPDKIAADISKESNVSNFLQRYNKAGVDIVANDGIGKLGGKYKDDGKGNTINSAVIMDLDIDGISKGGYIYDIDQKGKAVTDYVMTAANSTDVFDGGVGNFVTPLHEGIAQADVDKAKKILAKYPGKTPEQLLAKAKTLEGSNREEAANIYAALFLQVENNTRVQNGHLGAGHINQLRESIIARANVFVDGTRAINTLVNSSGVKFPVDVKNLGSAGLSDSERNEQSKGLRNLVDLYNKTHPDSKINPENITKDQAMSLLDFSQNRLKQMQDSLSTDKGNGYIKADPELAIISAQIDTVIGKPDNNLRDGKNVGIQSLKTLINNGTNEVAGANSKEYAEYTKIANNQSKPENVNKPLSKADVSTLEKLAKSKDPKVAQASQTMLDNNTKLEAAIATNNKTQQSNEDYNSYNDVATRHNQPENVNKPLDPKDVKTLERLAKSPDPKLAEAAKKMLDSNNKLVGDIAIAQEQSVVKKDYDTYNDIATRQSANPDKPLSEDDVDKLKNLVKTSKEPKVVEAAQKMLNNNTALNDNITTSQTKLINAAANQQKVVDASNGAILLNDIAQGKITLPLTDQQKTTLKNAGVNEETIGKINSGSIESISKGLSEIKSQVVDKEGKPIPDKDGNISPDAQKLGQQISSAINYVDSKAKTISTNIDNVSSEINKFGNNTVVSETGKSKFNTAMGKIEQDLINQIPKELRNTLAPDGKISPEAVKKFLEDPANAGKIDKSLADNLTKFSDVKSKLDNLMNRSVQQDVSLGKNEFNLMIGAREYLDPFINALEAKGIDTTFLMNANKTGFDYNKVLNFAKALQGADKGVPSDYPHKNVIEQILSKDSVGNPSENSLVKQAQNINQKFIEQPDLARTADQEAVDVIKSYGLSAKPGVVDIMTGPITQYASAVHINSTTLKDPKIKAMIMDSFGMALQAGLITQDDIDKLGTPPKEDPNKMFALFRQVENKLSEKYNGAQHDPNKVNLTTDLMFGAFHITNLQRAMYDKAQSYVSAVQDIDAVYDGTKNPKDSKALNDLVEEYNKTHTPPIDINQLKDNKELGIKLLDFAQGKLEGISASIGKFAEYGQLSELKRDIDGVIGKGKESGIEPLRNLLKSGNSETVNPNSATNKPKVEAFQKKMDDEITFVENAIKNGVTSINGKSTEEYLKELKTKYSEFKTKFNLPDTQTSATLERLDKAIESASKMEKPTSTDGGQSNAQEYKQNLEKTLNSLKQAIANGQTTVKIDIDGDGTGDESKPIAEVLKTLEKDYQEFLLKSPSDEHGNIQTMANLFSQVYLEAGLAGGNGAYSELNSGFALALESVGNIDVDKLFAGKTGQSTVSNSNDLTWRMIGNIDIDKLQKKFDDCFKDGKADPQKLAAILNSKFKNFSEQQATQFFAIAERLLKNAGINPVPDLSGDFQKSVAAGKGVQEAMESVLKSEPTQKAIEALKAKAPMGVLADVEPDNFDGYDKTTATTDRQANTIKPDPKTVTPPVENSQDAVTPPVETDQDAVTSSSGTTPSSTTSSGGTKPSGTQVAYTDTSGFLDGTRGTSQTLMA